MSRRLTATAYHEAGHLVVAVYNGIRVHSAISIEPGPDGELGRCGMEQMPPWRIDSNEGMIRLATACLAGDPAERLVTARSRRHRGYGGDLKDRLDLVVLLHKAYEDEDHAMAAFKKGRRRAELQVLRLRPQIEFVAAVLLEHRVLDAQIVRDYLYSLWSLDDLVRIARRTRRPFSYLRVLHENPPPLERYAA